MIRDGFQPYFPSGTEQQVEEIRAEGHAARPGADKGVYVRVFHPPAEGEVIRGWTLATPSM